jgi:uncharacterized protein YceK
MQKGDIMRVFLVLAVLTLSGCGQQFTGSAYKVQVGRQVTEVFQDTATTWNAGAEFRFDVRR